MPVPAPVTAAAASLAPAATTLAKIGNLPPAYWLAPIGAIAALVMAFAFYKSLMSHSEGDEDMIHIAQAVRDGAYAYLRRQYKVVAAVFAVLVGVLLVLGLVLHLQPALSALGVPIAGLFSGLCGFFGMKTATNASARTTHAARNSLNEGLTVAFRAGSVMGLCVTGFALLDISIWFFILSQFFGEALGGLTAITTITLSFAMGASLQALFARVGGGIYTKAADVGADLVGKVEAGIPEDDARNPATIADNVGDNVGDVAGMGADLYESYYGSILASMALAAAAAFQLHLGKADAMKLVVVPPALAGVGILLAILGIFAVRTKEGASMSQLLKSLHTGVWLASALIVVAAFGLLYWLLSGIAAIHWIGLWVAILAGLAAGLIIAWGTEYYTSYEHGPTKRISEQTQTGPATVIISGIAEGMLSTWIPLLTVVVAILVAFIAAGGSDSFLMGVFGVGVAAVGMLSTLAITLATDAYGPIADNAGGNAEMTHQEPYVRERTDMLDSLGNTTAATGKGFAIGSAALTALALLAAYVTTVQTSLTHQAEQAAALVDVASQEDIAYQAAGPLVLYHVPTAVEGETHVDAGLIINARNRSAIDEALSTGVKPDVSYIQKHQLYEASVAGHDFEIVPASTASLPQLLNYYNVTLMNPRTLCGLFLGVMLVFVFCAMTMNAVGRAAYRMMGECRRQFDIMKKAFKAQGLTDEQINDPLQWPYSVEYEGHTYPDYAESVAISTAGASVRWSCRRSWRCSCRSQWA